MNEMSADEMYWVWLSGLDGVFPKWFYMLQSVFLEPKKVWECANDIQKQLPQFPKALAENIRKAKSAEYFDGLFEYLQENDISFVTAVSGDYPYTLQSLTDPPPVLYYKGTLPTIWERSVSIVGTRKPTRNGVKTAQDMAAKIAAQGVLVVSGMARGIDTAAHTGALSAGGVTVAVLGTGVDEIYPKENKELYHNIIESGAVVSEFRPKTPPIAGNFPQRNRIIAALTAATIVSEGGVRSGARITADIALTLGRQVFAIPCDIGSDVSSLPIGLLKSGAELLSGSSDLMEAMGWKNRPAANKKKDIKKYRLDFLQEQIYNSLLKGDMTLEMLADEMEVPISQLGSALTMMEMLGAVVCLPGNYFSVNV